MKLVIRRVVVLLLAMTMVFTFVACRGNDVPLDYLDSDNVIEASQLKDLMADDKTIVIDARSEEEYNKGHLKGAINLPHSLLAVNEPVKAIIAPKEQIEAVLSAHGIDNDSNIYVYDNVNGIYASRIWWVLTVYGHENVKVINGGETAILQEGDLELTSEATIITPSTYTAKEANLSSYVSIEDVLAVVENDNSEICIIDVRSAAENAEGTIPGSSLYPHTLNSNEDGTFKSAWEIYLDYEDKGYEREDEIYLFCKSSVRATQTLLLLQEAGYENVKVYDGAWLEWSEKDVPKVEEVEVEVAPSTGDGS